MTKEDETSRVTMLWPVELKEQLRQRVGSRGLTKFAIEAVQAKLTGHDASASTQAQLVNDLRFARGYAQRLADSLACAGELEQRQERLMEAGVPSWIDTTGWPEWAAALQAPDVDTPVDTPVDEPAPSLGEPAGQEPVTEAPSGDTPVDHPAHDAPVEEWREYARLQGVPDLDGKANRSQIRTMLGIPHPVAGSDNAGERSRGFIPQDELAERVDQVKKDAEVASFVALAENPPTGAPALAKEVERPSQMRRCDPGCGEEYDVYVDGEFEKHLVHKHAAKRAEAEKPEPETPKVEAPGSQSSRPPDGMANCPFHPEMAVPVGGECYKCTLEKNGTDTTPKPRTDLFAKLQSDAKSHGLDLKPASEVLRPESEPEPYTLAEDEVPTEPASDLEVPAEPATPVETRPAIAVCPNHPGNEVPCALCCPTCGSELVDGECWECM